MPRTYDNEPYLIPNIFREIVGTVSDNLSTDTDLSIDQVSFKHGSWLKIQAQLLEEAKSEAHKSIRFPLIDSGGRKQLYISAQVSKSESGRNRGF